MKPEDEYLPTTGEPEEPAQPGQPEHQVVLAPEWSLAEDLGEETTALLSNPNLRKLAFLIAVTAGGAAGYQALRRYLSTESGGLEEPEAVAELEQPSSQLSALPLEDRLNALVQHLQTVGDTLQSKVPPTIQEEPEEASPTNAKQLMQQALANFAASLTDESLPAEQKQRILNIAQTITTHAAEVLQNAAAGRRIHADTAHLLHTLIDSAAFANLYQKYYRTIHNYFARYLPYNIQERAELVLDLTHEVFTKAFAAVTQGRFKVTGAPFGPFLYRSAQNMLFNLVRDRSKHKTVPLEPQNLSTPNQPELALLQASDDKRLESALAQLPPDRRLLLTLKFGEGLTNKQIGRIMGKSEGAVKSLYRRTLEQLRRILQEK